MPGQFGLNAGIMPSPGFTYANMESNYNTSTLDDNNGNAIPPKPTLNLWVVENIFEFVVPNTKFLGGNLGFLIIVPTIANGARNNIGSGYFGIHVIMGATVYLTKNKGTSANIFTDWEVHGQKQGTNGTYKTPGQAFTDEWGFGQILPLSKDLSKLIQIGAIGYDQWQITANGGTFAITGPLGNTLILPASALPFYSVHAAGGQVAFITPKKNLVLFFKYQHEFAAYSHTLGDTVVFGGSWTLRIPESCGGKS